MKKGLFLAMLALVVVAFSSCQMKTRATVELTVVNTLGIPQSGIQVFQFSSLKWNDPTLAHTPENASRYLYTDQEGKVTFDLTWIDLEVIDTQTTLHYAVFDREGDVIGKTAVTVRQGENKTATLKINSLY